MPGIGWLIIGILICGTVGFVTTALMVAARDERWTA